MPGYRALNASLPCMVLGTCLTPLCTCLSVGLQVSLKGTVMPAALSANPPKELQLAAIFNGGKMHPGQGGHVVVAELLITLAMVGGACVLAVRSVCVQGQVHASM